MKVASFFLCFFLSIANSSYGNTLSCPGTILKNAAPDIIFIGENHFDPLADDFVVNNLPLFKELGFEYFFAEYIESRDQMIVDRFNLDPKENIDRLFLTFGTLGDWGYDSYKYLSLSTKIAEAKMTLMGLDRRFDLMFEINQDRKMAIRDQHMFDIAENFVQSNPGKKIIFFNGSDHSFVNKHLSAPSFYERFIKRFPNLKVMNLKKDFYEDVTNERLSLAQNHLKLNLNCKSDFVLYDNESGFDYYIFKQDKPLFPISDHYSKEYI